MNSYLIIGGVNQERLKKASRQLISYHLHLTSPHPDLLLIQASPSLGINQVRQLQKFLGHKPYQAEIKAVVIPEAEKLTLPAQNAFLKTLEEPPKDSLIILCCQNEDQLLPTIISRCQIIKLRSKPQIDIDESNLNSKLKLLNSILKAGAGERLKLVEPYTKSREEAIKFLQEMTVVFHQVLRTKKKLKNFNSIVNNSQLVTIIKSSQETLSLLEANINVKLVLENLIINFPEEKT